MARPPSYTKKQRDRIFKLYEKGIPPKDLAKLFKISYYTIRNMIYYKSRRKATLKYYYKNYDKCRAQQKKYNETIRNTRG